MGDIPPDSPLPSKRLNIKTKKEKTVPIYHHTNAKSPELSCIQKFGLPNFYSRRFAITTAPTIAASSRIEATSKGNR